MNYSNTNIGTEIGGRKYSQPTATNLTMEQAQELVDSKQYVLNKNYAGKKLGNFRYCLTEDKNLILVWSQCAGRFFGVAKISTLK